MFIDCGSHDGCSIRKFRDTIDKESQYELYSFEPNPYFKKYYENPEDKQTHYNKAVWIYDGQVDFYVAGMTGGSTLEATKNKHNTKKFKQVKYNHHYPRENRIEKEKVDCVDLSGWIKNNFKKDDHIILKMDIEGAEYKVLEKLFNDNAIKYVNEIFVELHNARCGRTEADDSLLLKKINEEGIKYDTSWDALHKPYCVYWRDNFFPINHEN